MAIIADSSTLGKDSVCKVARRTGIPHTTVWVALQSALQFYPYEIQRHYELFPDDFEKRKAFAIWAYQKMAENDDPLPNVLWTDEAHFSL